MRYYPAAVTGDILDIKLVKDGVEYDITPDTKVEADGHNFTLRVTVRYRGEATSGGRVIGYVYPPVPADIQYDDDPDRWPYDAPDTIHTYTIDFGPIHKEGPWVALVVYTRVINGVEMTLASWADYIFTAGPVMPPAEVTGLAITAYSRR